MSLYTVVLAAGQGRRFGTPLKQCEIIDGLTLLQRTMCLAEQITPSRVQVVLGYQAERLQKLVATGRTVINPRWPQGLGSSLACGIAALPESASAVLILLVDQVAVTVADLNALLTRYTQANSAATSPVITCASYADGLGVPAIFPRFFFTELMALTGDQGAKKILNANPVVALAMVNAAIDIDTPQNLHDFITDREKASALIEY